MICAGSKDCCAPYYLTLMAVHGGATPRPVFGTPALVMTKSGDSLSTAKNVREMTNV